MISYPVIHYDESDEDELDEFSKKYEFKRFELKAVFEGKEFYRHVWTRNRTDFLELLAYWNRNTRVWKYQETYKDS
jgi:hypothetical protein